MNPLGAVFFVSILVKITFCLILFKTCQHHYYCCFRGNACPNWLGSWEQPIWKHRYGCLWPTLSTLHWGEPCLLRIIGIVCDLFVYVKCCRKVMHCWRVPLELGRPFVFCAPHWPGGRVWALSQLVLMSRWVWSQVMHQVVPRHSLRQKVFLP